MFDRKGHSVSDFLGQTEPGDQPDPSTAQPRRSHPAAATPTTRAAASGRGTASLRPLSPRPPRGPSRSARARPRAGLARHGVPTTVWTLPGPDDTVSTTSIAPSHRTNRPNHTRLPARIHRVLAAFGHPANALILTSAGGVRTPAGAVCLGVTGDYPPQGESVIRRDRPRADLSAKGASPGHPLVVLDVGCRGLDDRSAAAVAADLAPGATLAVLTHSHRDGGRLFDPSGAVIAALQDADLLYLQHIVIVEHTLTPQPRPQPEPESESADDATDGPGRGLVDLTLFLRPGSPPQSRPENGAAG